MTDTSINTETSFALVDAAWADSSRWGPAIEQLQQRSHRVALAANSTRVCALVYVAAIAPEAEETVISLFSRDRGEHGCEF